MAEVTWHGIPRSKIPWYPKIDYKKCVSCGKCVDYCKLGVFEFQEHKGIQRPVVKNPNHCVVMCTGCDGICSAGAIKHQTKKETNELIKKLRKKYALTNEKRIPIGEYKK